jgi:hypothetical protein
MGHDHDPVVGTDRRDDVGQGPTATHGTSSSGLDDAVDQLTEPDNQAKLLLAMAVVLLLTFLTTLGLLLDRLADDGDDPVLIDGVPCLVQEGEGDEALLFCQR